jgi:hypothetical protein
MKTTLYNLGSIRPPLTGIGRYAWELVRGGMQAQLPVAAYLGGKIRHDEQLLTALQEAQDAHLNRAALTRRWAGHIPFLRTAYQMRQSLQFSAAANSNSVDRYLYHNVTSGTISQAFFPPPTKQFRTNHYH